MRVDLRMKGLDAVRDQLKQLSGPQVREAYAAALNDAGYRLRRAMQAEIAAAFDRPTPWVANSPWITLATADRLSVAVLPTRRRDAPSGAGSGKVGVDPQLILQAQEWGGRRADKKSEVLLRRAGILPNGYQTAIPETPYPGSDDGRGNLRGTFVQQVLSYFQTFGEQGYRANMSERRKRALRNQQGIGSIANRKVYKTTLGVRFFVSYGRLRAGRTAHLAPGIWAARGTHDVEVHPVLMFVRTPSYSPRLSMERIAARGLDQDYFEKRLRFHIRKAVGV